MKKHLVTVDNLDGSSVYEKTWYYEDEDHNDQMTSYTCFCQSDLSQRSDVQKKQPCATLYDKKDYGGDSLPLALGKVEDVGSSVFRQWKDRPSSVKVTCGCTLSVNPEPKNNKVGNTFENNSLCQIRGEVPDLNEICTNHNQNINNNIEYWNCYCPMGCSSTG